jgi:DnaJ-class molecular chaperone
MRRAQAPHADWLVPYAWEKCWQCRGRGTIKALPPTCPKCKGEGRVPTAYTLRILR